MSEEATLNKELVFLKGEYLKSWGINAVESPLHTKLVFKWRVIHDFKKLGDGYCIVEPAFKGRVQHDFKMFRGEHTVVEATLLTELAFKGRVIQYFKKLRDEHRRGYTETELVFKRKVLQDLK
jgi:hypothetical protein